jgi:Fe2+ or Zn2+ uptake regulation protein
MSTEHLTPRNLEVLALIQAAERGIKIRTLCAQAQGISFDVMWKHLRRLREAGRVVTVGRSGAARWCTPERAGTVALAVEFECAARKKATKAKHAAKRWAVIKASRAAERKPEPIEVERDDAPIVQTVVRTWAPPVKTAPASVFEMGAFA